MSRREGPVRAPGEKVVEGVRRRAVLRAGAWAVPAVTVVGAAPAQAASAPATPPQLSLTYKRDEHWSLYVTVVLAAFLEPQASLVVSDTAGDLAWHLSGVSAPSGWVGGRPTGEVSVYAYTSSAASGPGRLDFIVGRSLGYDDELLQVSATLFGARGTPLVTTGPPTMVAP